MPEGFEQEADAQSERQEAPTFYLIDGHSLAYQAFYALPSSLRTGAGEPTNAVYGFVSMLLKLLEREPDYLAVVFDPKGETFRDEIYNEYKAQRPEMPTELRQQIPRLFEVLQAFNIPVVSVEGFEADDAIGTLARRGAAAGLAPRIVSRDRDLLQLIDEQITALLTRRGITDMDEWDLERFRSEYGIEPPQLVDVKAFMGDSSDNIPGVPSIGEKTALMLIQQFTDVDGVLANLDQVGGKKRPQVIREHEKQLKMSKTLAAIRTDVPIDVELEECSWDGPDFDALIPLFRQLEFGTFLDRMEIPAEVEAAVQPSLLTEAVEGEGEMSLLSIDSEAGLDALQEVLEAAYGTMTPAQRLPAAPEDPEAKPHPAQLLAAPLPWHYEEADAGPDTVLWLDLILAGEHRRGDPPLLLGVRQGSRAFLVKLTGDGVAPDQVLARLGPYLAAERVPVATHGCKALYSWLRAAGFRLRRVVHDLLLMAYLLDPSEGSYPLSRLSRRYLEQDLPSQRSLRGSGRRQKAWTDVEPDALQRYAGLRLAVMPELARVMEAELTAQDLDELYSGLELPLASILGEMQHVGLAADPAVLERLGEEFSSRLEELEARIHQEAGRAFNVNSTQQLGQILFEEMELPVIKRTKTGYSTDAEVLEQLAGEHGATIAEHVLDFRTLSKLQSTYVVGLGQEIDPATGRIHTSLNQTVAATGRLSSSEPNLQNIPVRLEMGRRLRRVFVAPPERCLLAADYSQIELRVLAHMSGDEGLSEAFRQGEDIHRRTAAEVFDVPPDQVTPQLRNRAKAVNFGIVYGISDFGLARQLDVGRAEAGDYIQKYLRRYPGVRAYMEAKKEEAREHGYVRTHFGRIRYLPEIHSRSWHRRQFAERTAINTPIQGTAADIIKMAMLAVDRALARQELPAWMVLQVHDELLFEVDDGLVAETAACVRKEMEEAVKLDVPLKVDVKSGQSWYGMKELDANAGEAPDAGTA